ncbi:gastrin/cholecystokinin type B receptor-like [Lytechinus variegatus]|uniref:gastrin/cholecystokinin type B receptor-like n=1 Tax=Lytechinus variegatus TaxID=7654 RepID=UPI001BB0D9B3|nr:gastrin/cholecystokinin type B receptor-like [Lytechinus variegatus]
MDASAIVAVSLFTIIFVIGVPGNSLVVWVFAKKSRKTTTSLLILSLSIIDLCACLIAPVHLVRSLGGGVINAFVCKSSIYGSRAFSFSALYLTTCIALDRYMAICRPLESRSHPRKLLVVILASIGLAVSGNFQFALYVKNLQIGAVKKCIYRGGPDWLDISNEIFTSVSYLVALVICSCVYVRIYLEIRKQMKVREGLTGNGVQGNQGADRQRNCFAISKAGGLGARAGEGQIALPQQSGTSISDFHEMATTSAQRGGSSGIIQGAATNGNLPVVGNTNLLRVKGPAEGNALQDVSSVEYSSYPAASVVQDQPPRVNVNPNRNRQRKERLMTRMLLGTNLILILSWLPSFILTNVPDEEVTAYRSKASQGVIISFCYQLRTLNHIVSIFVYALLNANFRKDCQAILAKLKRSRNG